jgi:hypothetical protein
VKIVQNNEVSLQKSAESDEISFLEREFSKQIYDTSVTLGDKHPSYSTVNNWVARFMTGHLSTEDEEHPGRPTDRTVPENLDAIHSMILNDHRIPR